MIYNLLEIKKLSMITAELDRDDGTAEYDIKINAENGEALETKVGG